MSANFAMPLKSSTSGASVLSWAVNEPHCSSTSCPVLICPEHATRQSHERGHRALSRKASCLSLALHVTAAIQESNITSKVDDGANGGASDENLLLNHHVR